MKETRFIEQNKDKWIELERMLSESKRDPDKASELFVQVSDDLSYARTYYGNRVVRVYLNQLTQKVFGTLLRNTVNHKKRFSYFWTDDLPAVIYHSRKELIFSFVLFVFCMLIGASSSHYDTDFAQILQQNIATDRQQQRTTEGIHRDDLVFSISQYPLKKYGSQGQQKSFLIALKLAIYELIAQHTQIKPILLLDDIFDKLDEQRIEQLLQVTACQPQKFGQIFISDTQQTRITAICAKFGIENKTFLMVNYKL